MSALKADIFIKRNESTSKQINQSTNYPGTGHRRTFLIYDYSEAGSQPAKLNTAISGIAQTALY